MGRKGSKRGKSGEIESGSRQEEEAEKTVDVGEGSSKSQGPGKGKKGGRGAGKGKRGGGGTL